MRHTRCGTSPQSRFPPVTPTFYRLPAALADKFRIVEVLPAGGAEAEIMILAGTTSDVKVIAKLYRPGIVPKTDVLERVSQAAFRHVVRLIAHGVSDGVGYEVMEYCPAGSLRTLMAESPSRRDRLRLIVEELAEALAALHDVECHPPRHEARERADPPPRAARPGAHRLRHRLAGRRHATLHRCWRAP